MNERDGSVFLFRHAMARYQRDQDDPGTSLADDLTDQGIEQARAMGQWVADQLAVDRGVSPPERVVLHASTYGRALQTARLIAEQLHERHDQVTLLPEPRLREDRWWEIKPEGRRSALARLMTDVLLSVPSATVHIFITHDFLTEPVGEWLSYTPRWFEPGCGVRLRRVATRLSPQAQYGVDYESPQGRPDLLKWLTT